MRDAACVIVLWSQAAVKSQWVRAEADIARTAGKLAQAVVDDCTPPIPFDQQQHADLKGWTGGANHPGWRKIEASVRGARGGELRTLRRRAGPRRSPPPAGPDSPFWLGAAAVLLALGPGSPRRMAVAPRPPA